MEKAEASVVEKEREMRKKKKGKEEEVVNKGGGYKPGQERRWCLFPFTATRTLTSKHEIPTKKSLLPLYA
jgi:hypothetical protein